MALVQDVRWARTAAMLAGIEPQAVEGMKLAARVVAAEEEEAGKEGGGEGAPAKVGGDVLAVWRRTEEQGRRAQVIADGVQRWRKVAEENMRRAPGGRDAGSQYTRRRTECGSAEVRKQREAQREVERSGERVQARHRQMGTQLKLQLMMWKGEEGRERRWREALPAPWPVGVKATSKFQRQEYMELPASSVGRVVVDAPDDGYVAVASGEYDRQVHDWYGWAAGQGKVPAEHGPADRERVVAEAKVVAEARREEEKRREEGGRKGARKGEEGKGWRGGEDAIGGIVETQEVQERRRVRFAAAVEVMGGGREGGVVEQPRGMGERASRMAWPGGAMTINNKVAAIKKLFHRKQAEEGGVSADLQSRYDEVVLVEQGDAEAVAREEAREAARTEREAERWRRLEEFQAEVAQGGCVLRQFQRQRAEAEAGGRGGNGGGDGGGGWGSELERRHGGGGGQCGR